MALRYGGSAESPRPGWCHLWVLPWSVAGPPALWTQWGHPGGLTRNCSSYFFDSVPDPLSSPVPYSSRTTVLLRVPSHLPRTNSTCAEAPHVKGPDATGSVAFADCLFLTAPLQEGCQLGTERPACSLSPTEAGPIPNPLTSNNLNRRPCLQPAPASPSPPSGSRGSSWMVATTLQPPSGARLLP